MRAVAPLIILNFILGIALGGSLAWMILQSQQPGHHWYDTFTEHTPDWFVALFTLALTVSTTYLWIAARDSTDKLISMERPYLTGGGDFETKRGFRLDVENHGKTPAFMTGYDIRFAKLKELEEETKQNKAIRRLCKNRFRHMDGISPGGARKNIFTQIPIESDADIVFGAVYYRDAILGDEHDSRFLLRIAPSRDIPGEGLTRLDGVKDVSEKYWDWDYPNKEQA
jgi:hypothetical protein